MEKAIRPEVKRYSELIESQLRLNDGKGGWKDCPVDYLLAKLGEEVGEVFEARIKGDRRQMVAEAADVGAVCMMLCDVIGGLTDKNKTDKNNPKPVSGRGQNE